MTRLSGLATRQTSLTPSAQTCGFSPSRPNRSIAAPVRWPCVPSASTVTRATTSEPGSKFGSSRRRSATAGASSSSCPRRIAHASPAGPAPTIATPTSIRSSSDSVGGAIASAELKGGGKSEGFMSYERSKVQTSSAENAQHFSRFSRRAALPDELGQFWDDLVQVTDHAEVGVLEDRRIGILVDRDDHV